MSEEAEPSEDTATSERPSEQSNTVSEEAERPALRIITPSTTPEEVAAIVAVFASMGSGTPSSSSPVRTWSSPARALGIVHRSGAGAWRTSALPR